MNTEKTPIIRSDDDELLGFIVQISAGSWEARTVFDYIITRTTDRQSAEETVRRDGLKFLSGIWQYYDKDDYDWHPCVIKEANQTNVTVVRTNVMGYQDPDNYKLVVIESPDETRFLKSQ